MKKKVELLVLFSALCCCIWSFVLIHLNETQKQFESEPVEIVLVEKTKDEILYEKQVEFFNQDSIEIANQTSKLSKKYDIPLEVIYALIQTESDGINGRVSNANCVGLTQVGEKALLQYNQANQTDYSLSECKDNIEVNLEVGVWYYNWCVRQVRETKHVWQNAYLMFNVGYGHYKKFYDDWVEGINPITNGKYRALNRFKSKLQQATIHFLIN